MSAESDIRFLRQLQRLLEEGLFTSTYKFALLQALADLSVEHDADPDGTLRLTVAAIAEKFIEYYWRQALPFAASADPDSADTARAATLLQNTDRQASIIQTLAEIRIRYDGNLPAIRQDTKNWIVLRRKVASVIRQMPLWKLQTIGRTPSEFLYRKAEYRKADDTIRLLPGAPAALRNFHGLATNMIRGAWVQQVQRIPANQPILGKTASLNEFLFGSDRASLDGYRGILRDHQGSECFYCGRTVRGAGDLDHFIAWSRYPVDLGHNFVFTHPECNRDKRDYLAHPDHLRRWREQNLDAAENLGRRFSEGRLNYDAGRSRQIATWAYAQGELSGAHVWLREKTIQPMPRSWRLALNVVDIRIAAETPPAYRR